MFCPICRAEYRDGFYECTDCDVDLVEELEPLPEVPDFVKLATLFSEGDIAVIKSSFDDAGIAYYLLVPARTGSGNNPDDGITLFLVDAKTPGLNIVQLTTIPGDNQCEVIFDNVRISAEHIIGKQDEGWAPLSRSMKIAEVMMSSQMLGAGERLYKDSEEDFMTRLESGVPDDIKQHNEEYLTNLKQDIDVCRRITYQAANRLAEGESFDFEGSITANWRKYTHQNA